MSPSKIKFVISCSLLTISSSLFAVDDVTIGKFPFYASAKFGVFQANFNSTYTDQTDIIPQNIAELIQQNGYTEGLAIGYRGVINHKYIVGVEISGNYDSHSANFQAGASSAGFSDTVQINNHFDLTITPGFLITDSVDAYLKVGVTHASVQDTMISPIGFTPTITRYPSNVNSTGFVAGFGIEKFFADQFSVFAEGNYRDYGTVSFANFQNFTASYTNSTHVYAYDVGVGAAFHF